MRFLLEASPTILFFVLQAAGVPKSFLALGIAIWAAGVIALQWRKAWPRDPVFFGCNIHFMVAGPLLWGLFLAGMSGVAQPILDNVLLGVPLAVWAVVTWRAFKGQGSWVLAGIAVIAVLISASDPQDYVRAISLPLGVVLLGRVVLARLGVG